jgi:L,D-transpeptidase ErfK/SrfK
MICCRNILFILFILAIQISFAQNSNLSSNQKIDELQSKLKSLKLQYRKLQPKRPYIIVNTSENKFAIHDGAFNHRAKCSTGSYILLKAQERREWLFKTPRGVFRITVKLRDPVWYKPDWAFIEEGLPIPLPDSPKRYQHGVLGDYAVAFGQGYLIHGTLYKRLLGMPVTHGCVRLDDYDMQLVFDKIHHGSKVFIF